jgi:cell division protein ZapD
LVVRNLSGRPVAKKPFEKGFYCAGSGICVMFGESTFGKSCGPMHIGAKVVAPLRYEFPLTERMRMLLRLEDSLRRVREHADLPSPEAHRYALVVLCELVELTSRIDLKSEIRIEADRQRSLLRSLRNLNGVDANALEDVLGELDTMIGRIDGSSHRAGTRCRDDGWLSMVRTRMSVPGGLTRFDMPSFHCWSAMEPSARRDCLLDWLQDFDCLSGGVDTLLRLLRGTAETESQQAIGGHFMRAVTRQPLLVTVDTEPDSLLVPEVSANRSGLQVRFMRFSPNGRPRPCEDGVTFGLAVTYAS